jgi:hypothetical protein
MSLCLTTNSLSLKKKIKKNLTAPVPLVCLGKHSSTVKNKPTHLLCDILKPVDCMLHRRDANVQVFVDCNPPDLIVQTDPLRLKQVILNLARNSIKFVEQGYIKMSAYVVVLDEDGSENVMLSVEDSGPGIPASKKQQLFSKFQSSLDTLNQGTGIGLCLCEKLVALMGGELYIDEEYDSGIPDFPGTRFIVSLNTFPLDWKDDDDVEGDDDDDDDAIGDSTSTSTGTPTDNINSKCQDGDDCECTVGGIGKEFCVEIVDLEAQPQMNGDDSQNELSSTSTPTAPSSWLSANDTLLLSPRPQRQLPKDWNVLFVDDDMMLRKLFARSVKKVAPSWTIHEASNGETAINLHRSDQQFDLIFMDQYMASVTKQLLGTETGTCEDLCRHYLFVAASCVFQLTSISSSRPTFPKFVNYVPSVAMPLYAG